MRKNPDFYARSMDFILQGMKKKNFKYFLLLYFSPYRHSCSYGSPA